MKIVQTKTITNTFDVELNQKLLVKDYEERRWEPAKITGIIAGEKLKIKCADGMEYWETLEELSNPYSYKFD